MKSKKEYQPKTGATCGCRRGVERDNCPSCEGTGMVIDFKAIREKRKDTNALFTCDNCGKSMSSLEQSHLVNEPDGSQTWKCKPPAATHTPGPWKVFDGGPGADNTQFVSTGIGGRYICETDNSSESKANARLIAAAPELLEALKALAECHEAGYHPSIDKWMKVKEAIAKAEGRQTEGL